MLARWIDEHRELPMRWVKRECLHVTVLFIGYAHETEMIRIATGLKEAVSVIPSFNLEFSHIASAPVPERPRMIWHEGRPCRELGMLTGILSRLDFSRVENGRPARSLRPHITLGRIRQEKRGPQNILPAVYQEFRAVVPVSDIFLMESELGPAGPVYTVLESALLS